MKVKKNFEAILLIMLCLLLKNDYIFANDTKIIINNVYIGGWDCPKKRTNLKPTGNYCRLPHKAAEENIEKQEFVKQFIAIDLRGVSIEHKCSDIKEYLEAAESWSLLSLSNANIVILIQDDFVWWWKKCTQKNIEFLRLTKMAITKHNKILLYGITFYETDFDKLTDNELFAMGKQIDALHFYFHRRSNVNNYSMYINMIKKYFPRTKIIFGVYNYDRRNYERRYDSDNVEIKLFIDQLNYCYKKLMTDNSILGIEFYPGSLGEPKRLLMRKKLIGDAHAEKITKEINLVLERWLIDVL